MTTYVLFLEGLAALSRMRLSNNRSVMPLDVLGRTRATMGASAGTPWPKGPGNPMKSARVWDWRLKLSSTNKESPVGACHQHAPIKSLPFVHTARRYYRLSGLVRPPDWRSVFLRVRRCRWKADRT